MELWIRSQDKERLIKVSTLFVEYNGDVDPTISPHRIVADKCIDLGIYKTKERAIEVLDEIQKLLEPKFILQTEEIEKPITEYMSTFEQIKDIKELSTCVYEMPKE